MVGSKNAGRETEVITLESTPDSTETRSESFSAAQGAPQVIKHIKTFEIMCSYHICSNNRVFWSIRIFLLNLQQMAALHLGLYIKSGITQTLNTQDVSLFFFSPRFQLFSSQDFYLTTLFGAFLVVWIWQTPLLATYPSFYPSAHSSFNHSSLISEISSFTFLHLFLQPISSAF